MAEIVNLRRARKAKARDVAESAAQVNRVAFGRSKSERQGTEAEQARALRQIEGHRRVPQPMGQSEERSGACDPPPHDDA